MPVLARKHATRREGRPPAACGQVTLTSEVVSLTPLVRGTPVQHQVDFVVGVSPRPC